MWLIARIKAVLGNWFPQFRSRVIGKPRVAWTRVARDQLCREYRRSVAPSSTCLHSLNIKGYGMLPSSPDTHLCHQKPFHFERTADQAAMTRASYTLRVQVIDLALAQSIIEACEAHVVSRKTNQRVSVLIFCLSREMLIKRYVGERTTRLRWECADRVRVPQSVRTTA